MYDPKNLPLLLKLLNMDKTLSLHHGYFEKGVYTHIKAMQNMNKHIEDLLHLDSFDNETKCILDAGCGIGGTVIYLAKKYPNTKFIGITINPEQANLAIQLAKENNVVNNTQFILMNYLHTDFPPFYFDNIFALESLDFTYNKNDFVIEMFRILKPNGKLVVISAFQADKQLNSFLENIKNLYFKGLESPSYITIEKFQSFLEEEGFTEIKMRNINRNIRRSIIGGLVLNFLIFLYFFPKKFLLRKKEEQYFSKKIYVIDTIFFIKKYINYWIITAIKK